VTLIKDNQHNQINGTRTSGNSWHYASELFKKYPPKQYTCFAQYFLAESAWLDI
jgi:hypothetical protein